jgi:hypothetical protein
VPERWSRRALRGEMSPVAGGAHHVYRLSRCRPVGHDRAMIQ